MEASVGKQVLLIEPLDLIRCGLRSIITLVSEMRVCGGAKSLENARRLRPSPAADIVIVDPLLEGGRGFEFIQNLHLWHPGAKAVICGSALTPPCIERAFQCGARAAFTHRESEDAILASLIAVCEGRQHLAPGASEIVSNRFSQPSAVTSTDMFEARLAPRQMQVLRLLADDLPLKEIANRMKVSKSTVESVQAALKEKLGAQSMVELRHKAVLYFEHSNRAA